MRRIQRLVRTVIGRLAHLLRGQTRYDLVLGLIPAAMGTAGVAAMVLPVTATTAIGGAAVLSALAVVDALFLNPPPDASSGRPPA